MTVTTPTHPGNRPIRTILYVPADRPDRVVKAHAAPTDAIAIDLEDAVAISRKEAARGLAVDAINALPSGGPGIFVRINAIESEFGADDIAALAPVLRRIDALILPMTDGAASVRTVEEILGHRSFAAAGSDGVALLPLIESAQGIARLDEIAGSSDRIRGLALGPADLTRQLGIVPTASGDELLYARQRIVLASAAAGLPHPFDGPYLDLDDHTGLRLSARQARRFGFGGKQVIHPSQLTAVAAEFAPTERDIAWARNVVEAFQAAEASGISSIRLDDGTFVDYPVAERAAALLREASSEPAR